MSSAPRSDFAFSRHPEDGRRVRAFPLRAAETLSLRGGGAPGALSTAAPGAEAGGVVVREERFREEATAMERWGYGA